MIKRTIYLDKIEELDTDNFGVHFTENLNYTHKGGGSNGLTVEKLVRIDAYIFNSYEINKPATEVSRENYPEEKEIVLKENQELNATVRISIGTQLNGRIARYRSGFSEQNMIINTGTRSDEWVKKI